MKYLSTKIILLLLLPLIGFSQSHNLAMVDSFMRAKAAIHNFNGNVLIAKEGKILYQKSFGYSNLDMKVLLDENSMFDLGSIAKQFTAMGILLLHQNKTISLQDSLRKFFPELPYSKITIHQLLTHTSGLPPYEPLLVQKWDHKEIASNSDAIKLLVAEKPMLLFEPGTKWRYCNTGYMLLASIIEKVSRQSFYDYMHKNIFDPLKMKRTRVYNTRRSGETIANYAYGYQWSDNRKKYLLPDSIPKESYVYYMDGLQGEGAISSTMGDLLKWDRALKSGKLLKQDLQNQMFSHQAISDTSASKYYGYGVRLDSTRFGKRIYHGGGWPGYLNFYSRYIEEDLSIIVLSNNQSNSEAISEHLASLFYNESVVFPYTPKPVAIDIKMLERYVGTYSHRGSWQVIVVVEDGNLYVKGSPDIPLTPESSTLFFYETHDDRKLEFAFDDTGNVKKVWWITDGMRYELFKKF